MRASQLSLFILTASLLTGCARPLVVKEVAAASKPLIAQVQRASGSLQRQFDAQRKDLALSKAAYETLRSEPARLVTLKEAIWQDRGRTGERNQLAALRRFDADVRAQPYAVLTLAASLETAPVSAPDSSGLIDAARALERLEKDRNMSLAEFGEFAASVEAELKKLEQEANEKGVNLEAGS